ncbi:MAG: phospho-N-acetylmuramoyl-pentapeptide-transferase [Desulforudis sp.]|jgi:phospho-N-acetylmuramoyl-pentapeptide-transferase|nr:MAG: phospho-N-acetylmuramoyl-pentapeptide-transferase [Desulforudis sp.]
MIFALLLGGIALVISLLLGPIVIPVLRRLKFGQRVRSDGPSRHLQKSGTPTMGGIIFILSSTAAVLLGILMLDDRPELGTRVDGLVVLLVLVGFGTIGFLDDYIKIVLKRPLGLRAREKLLGQVLIAVALAVVAVYGLGRGTDIVIPFSGFLVPGGIVIELGWWLFLAFTVFILLGTTNAVNLTDGLDGLASGLMVIAALAFAVIAVVSGHLWVALVLGAIAGGCLGFLYYNWYPARVFMGDTGSLALGGGLAAAAVLTRSEVFLAIIGGVFVIETLSVMAQVFSYQLFRRRVLRMAPLHHHFELSGWTETRVVFSFWAAGLILAAVGLAGIYRLG